MKKYAPLLTSILFLFAACNKNPANPDISENKSDATKVLTLVEYDYQNGNAYDSTIKNLISINEPTGKKFIITMSYSPVDSDIVVYKLNLQNQLTEVRYTYSDDPASVDRDIYTWSGNNLTKVENEESGKITHTYNLNYSPFGQNTRVTYTETPQRQSDTLFGGGHIIYLNNSQSAFIVTTGDFKPVGIEQYSYTYVNNSVAKPAEIKRDTIYTSFVFSTSGDLQQKIISGTTVDSNANEHTGVIDHYKDSLVYNYNRDNGNESLSTVFKNIFGNQVFVLSSFYGYTGAFANNELLPEMFENEFFINHPLNKETRATYSWENGIPVSSGQSSDENTCQNSYDNQNRLISSKMMDDNNQPMYGFRVIRP